jgi:acyl-coenzyme A thioesterase PaaI-like protein
MMPVDAPPPFDPRSEGWQLDIGTPFTTLVGPIWRRGDGESAVTGLLTQPKHANQLGLVDSGVLLTFADHAIGIAGARRLPHTSQVTIQLSTMLWSEARVGDFIEGRSEVVQVTSTLTFIRGTLSIGNRMIASAEGIWKIMKPTGETE